MSEAEWLTSTEPNSMLGFLQGKAGDRKLRLFACACCRQVWDLLVDDRSRRAVELAELASDEVVPEEALDAASAAAEEAFEETTTDGDGSVRGVDLEAASSRYAAACYAASYCSNPPVRHQDILAVVDATIEAANDPALLRRIQADLLRDVFDNPFRPAAVSPAWLTDTVRSLADVIYADRAFDRLPILADALEDAGCDAADVLAHCRGPGPHVRGCWVVDLVLGQS